MPENNKEERVELTIRPDDEKYKDFSYKPPPKEVKPPETPPPAPPEPKQPTPPKPPETEKKE